MEDYRNKTKKVQIGNVCIGGGERIAIQSMTNTKTEDVEACVAQILKLEKAGCDIIRVAVPTMEAAESIRKIKEQIHIPLVADIHFDYRLAIAAIENGADKIRINPGNIGDEKRVRAVVEKAKEYNIPIRVGVNSGSLEKHLVEKYHGVTAEGLVESALDKVHMIEEMGYDNLVVSIKSSDVMMCVKAHELLAPVCPYPLHVGITESGTLLAGNIKSSIGLGLILSQGIGDTIRVSLTGDPVELTYTRDGLEYHASITPKEYRTADSGFTYNIYCQKAKGLDVIRYGAVEVKYMIRTTVLSLKELCTGKLGVKDLSGPVGVVDAIGTTYEQSKSEGTVMLWMNMLNMAVLLSANLGVMNLLPFPALDGGRLVFLVVEAVRRKPINRQIEGMVHFAGLMLLMVLMVAVMYNDIVRIF